MTNAVSKTKTLLTTKDTKSTKFKKKPSEPFVSFVIFVVKTIFASSVAALPRWDLRGEN